MYFHMADTGFPAEPIQVELRADDHSLLGYSDSWFDNLADATTWVNLLKANAAAAPVFPPSNSTAIAHYFVGLIWGGGFGWNLAAGKDPAHPQYDQNILDGLQPYPSRETATAAIAALRTSLPTAPIA